LRSMVDLLDDFTEPVRLPLWPDLHAADQDH
jgi:hypothetical protein